jgi:uncharacterized protein
VDLTHRFSVPTGVEEAWAHFNDIASVAECFPGAAVTSVEEETFHGSVKVKLGPIALVYNGSGTFKEKDEGAHRFVVEAKGKDKRGNGTAGATVTLTMAEAADLAITGKPAQFGRGVMQDVSDKLLGQFIGCLEQRMGAPEPAPPEVVPDGRGPAEPAEGPDRQGVPPTSPQAGSPQAGPSQTAAPRHLAGSAAEDHLDLGATVLPVLARTYWRQGVGALVVLFLLWRWLGRR